MQTHTRTHTHTLQIAAWLGSSVDAPALEYSIDESHRPVRLRRVVLGYPDANSEFKFDLSLNYRLSGVIQCYSDQKPTLVVSMGERENGEGGMGGGREGERERKYSAFSRLVLCHPEGHSTSC